LALSGTYEALLTYVGSGLLLFSGFTVAAVYLLRYRNVHNDRKFFRVPGYPFTPAIFLSVVEVSWIQSLQERPGPTGAALLTLLAGFAFYLVGRAFGLFNTTPFALRPTSSAD
jgi:basic amino acid/polyamine antiporter, APA family